MARVIYVRKRESVRKRLASRVERGLCIDCPNPKDKESFSRCRSCLDRANERQKVYDANRRARLLKRGNEITKDASVRSNSKNCVR